MDNQNPKNARESQEKVTSIFPTSGDTSFIFAYKKTERLTTALFMVTDFIAPRDSLRATIREKGLSLLSRVIDLYVEPSAHSFNVACAAIGEIVATLTVVSRMGYVSPMNYKLLESEYSELARFLREREQQFIVRPSMLDTSFFNVGVELTDMKKPVSDMQSETSAGAGQNDTSAARRSSRYDAQQEAATGTPAPSESYKGQVMAEKGRATEQNRKKKDRRAIILSVLQEKDKITINDLIPIMKDMSGKTIQRELTALVEQGLLRKEGKKRWSSYMLS